MLTWLQMVFVRKLDGDIKLHYVDIGASAMTKPRIGTAFSEFEVVAFDPDPRSEADFINIGFDVRFHPYAVAGENGQRKLYLTKKSHCSSLLKPLPSDDWRYQVEREIDVECRTLDSFNICADVLKIDVQGAELDILKQAKNTLAGAHVVELEVWFERKYEKQAQIEDLQDWMNKQGFRSAGFSALYFDSTDARSGIAFADMVFLRPPTTVNGRKIIVASLISAALDHLIAHFLPRGVFRSIDTWLVAIIQLIATLKFRAPKVF